MSSESLLHDSGIDGILIKVYNNGLKMEINDGLQLFSGQQESGLSFNLKDTL